MLPRGTQRAVLRLQAVREEDAGQYVCEALGEAGVAFNNTVLDVGCKSLPLLFDATEHSSLSPLRSLPAQLPLTAFQGSSLAPSSQISQRGGVSAQYKLKPGGISKGQEERRGSRSGRRLV